MKKRLFAVIQFLQNFAFWGCFEAVVSSVVCLKSSKGTSCELYLLYRGPINPKQWGLFGLEPNIYSSFKPEIIFICQFQFSKKLLVVIKSCFSTSLSSQNLSLNFILSSLVQQFGIMAMGFKFYFSWVSKPRFSISSF